MTPEKNRSATPTNAPHSAIAGAWELVSAKWPNGSFPEEFSGSLLKIYSANDFAFVGRTTGRNGDVQERYGGGKFEWDGDNYRELVSFHCVSGLVGRTIHFHLMIDRDILTLTGPVRIDGDKAPGFQLVEIYRKKP